VNKTWKKILLVANVVLVLMTLLSYLSPYLSPDTFWFIPVLGLLYPALLFANVIAFLFWYVIHKKFATISLLTLIIGFSSCRKLITYNRTDAEVENSFVIGSYNTNFSKPIAFSAEENRSLMGQAFEKYLSGVELDILCVQEHGWRSEGHIQRAMNFPYKYIQAGMTVAIYSHHPIVNTGLVDFDSNIANACLWADIKVHGDTVRVYSAHLESNRHDGKVPEKIEQEAPEAMSNSALLGLVLHYQKFAIARVQQARLIQKHQMEAPYPVIICGDINDTPQTYTYRVIKGDMQDTFIEEGKGIGSTFGEKIPGLRIDHIFADPEIEVLDHKISRNNSYSDHYLLYSTMALN